MDANLRRSHTEQLQLFEVKRLEIKSKQHQVIIDDLDKTTEELKAIYSIMASCDADTECNAAKLQLISKCNGDKKDLSRLYLKISDFHADLSTIGVMNQIINNDMKILEKFVENAEEKKI